MDREEISKAIQRQQLADSLKQDFIGTLDERISRYQELDFIKVTPDAHFAPISAECILLYRDGHFLACIALCQAVAEAIVRLMCERSKFGASISKDYEKMLKTSKREKSNPIVANCLRKYGRIGRTTTISILRFQLKEASCRI